MKNNKNLKIGIYTVSVAAVAVVIAVLINMLVGYIPVKYTKFDTSGLELHKISEETEKIVSTVENDVTLYLIVEEGMQDLYVSGLLERYASANSNITLKEIDPVLHPVLTTPCGQSYELGEYEENSVIVSGPMRDKVIPYADIFKTEYTEEEMYYYYYYGVEPAGTTSFQGEAKVTGAIMYAADENPAKVYMLQGHGESAFGTNLSGYLADDNYDVQPLSLMSVGMIPQDTGCIVVNNPTSDITAQELTLLTDYVKNGGRIVLVTGYNGFNVTTLPNVCALGSAFGINALDGVVIEGDANHFISSNGTQYPTYILPSVSAHVITESVSNMYVLMPAAHGLSFAEDIDGLTLNAILTTTSQAYSTSGQSIAIEDAVNKGQMQIGAIAEVASGEKNGALVWYSSVGITDDSVDSYVSGGNSALFLSTLSYLCEKEESPSIAAKSMAVDSLVINEGAASMWSTLITVVIPLAVIIPGFIYWLLRRKK